MWFLDLAIWANLLLGMGLAGAGAVAGIGYEFWRQKTRQDEEGLILVSREHWAELWDFYYSRDERLHAEREDVEYNAFFDAAEADDELDAFDPFFVADGEEELQNSTAFQALIGDDEPVTAAFDSLFKQTLEEESDELEPEILIPADDSVEPIVLDSFCMADAVDDEEEEEVAPVFMHHWFDGQIVAQ